MFVNKSRNPSASDILSHFFLNKERRKRGLTTGGLRLLVRRGIYMPSLTKRRRPKVVKTLLLNSLFENNWESISEALGFLLLLTNILEFT